MRALLVDTTNPLNALAPDEREDWRRLCKPGRRTTLPAKWRELLAVCISRGIDTPTDLAHALGMSRGTFVKLREEIPAINEHVAACTDRYVALHFNAIETVARETNDVELRKYLLRVKDSARFGDRPQVQVNNQTNNFVPTPQVSRDDVLNALGVGTQPPAIEHTQPTRVLPADVPASLPKVTR